jgi:excinuclease ABC subunit C
MTTLALPLTDVVHLKRRVHALAEDRPAVYRMLDPAGRVIYVGKAKRLRTRLLSYFRARYPEDKAARILNATADIQWDPQPSEFAALLSELRQIRRHRPIFNVRMNRRSRIAFAKVSSDAAPKVYVGSTTGAASVRHYGPFTSAFRLKESIRVLNDLLGLRDCSLATPIVYAEQGDLFNNGRRAGCIRYDLDRCSGPCAGLITKEAYATRVAMAIDFLEGRALAPIDQIVAEMSGASESGDFERAAWWREKFEHLEWLLAASTRVRAAVNALNFVYVDPGQFGDDRAYVMRGARVRAAAPAPRTPLEREAFRALVATHAGPADPPGPIPAEHVDETLLLLSWFRRHPAAFTRTTAFEVWLERPAD